MSLRKSSTNTLIRTNDKGQSGLSIYHGELTNEVMAKSVAKVKAAFPSLTPAFFDLLIERVKAKGFSNQRLIDSIENLIDNCQYPTPTLANILSFDKMVRVLTYQELCILITKNEASFDGYSKIKVNGKIHYVSHADKAKFKIPDEL